MPVCLVGRLEAKNTEGEMMTKETKDDWLLYVVLLVIVGLISVYYLVQTRSIREEYRIKRVEIKGEVSNEITNRPLTAWYTERARR